MKREMAVRLGNELIILRMQSARRFYTAKKTQRLALRSRTNV